MQIASKIPSVQEKVKPKWRTGREKYDGEIILWGKWEDGGFLNLGFFKAKMECNCFECIYIGIIEIYFYILKL